MPLSPFGEWWVVTRPLWEAEQRAIAAVLAAEANANVLVHWQEQAGLTNGDRIAERWRYKAAVRAAMTNRR